MKGLWKKARRLRKNRKSSGKDKSDRGKVAEGKEETRKLVVSENEIAGCGVWIRFDKEAGRGGIW